MNKYNFYDTLKNRAKEGIKIKLILDSFGSIDLSNDEGDNDGMAAMIASAGDDGEEPDLKARSVASTSSLHTYHTDDDVDDLGTDDVNDLVGKLLKKAMEVTHELGGEGYTSFTIASPTGEGLTTAVHFSSSVR